MALLTTSSVLESFVASATRDAIIRLNNLINAVANLPRGLASIAIGTTTTKARTTAVFAYALEGAPKSKASTDDLWTLAGTTLTAGQINKYLLYLDAAGAATMAEGVPATTAAGVVLPALPVAKCICGWIQVTCNSSTFVPGTTALNAGTITTVFNDGVPSDYFTQVGDKNNNNAAILT